MRRRQKEVGGRVGNGELVAKARIGGKGSLRVWMGGTGDSHGWEFDKAREHLLDFGGNQVTIHTSPGNRTSYCCDRPTRAKVVSCARVEVQFPIRLLHTSTSSSPVQCRGELCLKRKGYQSAVPLRLVSPLKVFVVLSSLRPFSLSFPGINCDSKLN